MGAELQSRPVPSWETFGGLISQGVAMGEMRELRHRKGGGNFQGACGDGVPS